MNGANQIARADHHPSLAAVWNGSALIPEPEAESADAEVWFAVPPDSDIPGAPPRWEALKASSISDDAYVVRGCPALLSGVVFGDTVRVIRSAEGALVVTELLERSGLEGARLWFENGGDSWRRPTESLAARGAVVDVYSPKLVGICWAPATGLEDTLRQMEADGVLVYATS